MNRLTLGATAVLLGFGAMTMAGCSAGGAHPVTALGGAGVTAAPTAGHTAGSVPAGGTSAPATSAPAVSPTTKASGKPGRAPSAPPPAGPVHLQSLVIGLPTAPPTGTEPYFVSASLVCVKTGEVTFPGEVKLPTYQPELSWELKNATGMALSIDNPGLVGSYDSYEWHGSTILGSGCYTDNGSHTLVLYSTGGTGPQAQVTIHEQGTMTEPSPPPFAYPTSTPTH